MKNLFTFTHHVYVYRVLGQKKNWWVVFENAPAVPDFSFYTGKILKNPYNAICTHLPDC